MVSNGIAIIDLDSILFAGAWGNKILNPETGDYLRDEKGRLLYQDKTEEEIRQSIDDILIDILDNTKATGHIMYVKGKNTSAHRYKMKSDYKSKRPKESPSWWEFAKNYVIDSWEAVTVDTIEVDDAVNITRLIIPDSFIVAIDNDLLHLEGTHYNWKTNEWINTTKEEANLHFWIDMLKGQPGDGISGLIGYGIKKSHKVLENIPMWEYDQVVLNEYIKVFGVIVGTKEFVKNYTCLFILEEFNDLKIPLIKQWKNIEGVDEDDISWLNLN